MKMSTKRTRIDWANPIAGLSDPHFSLIKKGNISGETWVMPVSQDTVYFAHNRALNTLSLVCVTQCLKRPWGCIYEWETSFYTNSFVQLLVFGEGPNGTRQWWYPHHITTPDNSDMEDMFKIGDMYYSKTINISSEIDMYSCTYFPIWDYALHYLPYRWVSACHVDFEEVTQWLNQNPAYQPKVDKLVNRWRDKDEFFNDEYPREAYENRYEYEEVYFGTPLVNYTKTAIKQVIPVFVHRKMMENFKLRQDVAAEKEKELRELSLPLFHHHQSAFVGMPRDIECLIYQFLGALFM